MPLSPKTSDLVVCLPVHFRAVSELGLGEFSQGSVRVKAVSELWLGEGSPGIGDRGQGTGGRGQGTGLASHSSLTLGLVRLSLKGLVAIPGGAVVKSFLV